jgi:addiction module HigA family antidote
MPKQIKTAASVLKTYMDEFQLNPMSLSKAIDLSYSMVRMVVNGRFKISVPTALRFAKFFNTTPAFWLDLQRESDLIEAGKDKKLQASLKKITRAVKPIKGAKADSKVKPGKKAAVSVKRKQTRKASRG